MEKETIFYQLEPMQTISNHLKLVKDLNIENVCDDIVCTLTMESNNAILLFGQNQQKHSLQWLMLCGLCVCCSFNGIGH